MSFSGYGYRDQHMGHHQPPMGNHEQQMEHRRLDTQLTTIEETQHDILNTLHQHTQWQAEMGECITTI